MIHVVTRTSETIVCITGEFGDETSGSLESHLEHASRPGLFVVDLTRCSYVDSSAISVLVRLWRRYEDRFEVRIAPAGLVHRVFEICGFLSTDLFVKIARPEDAV